MRSEHSDDSTTIAYMPPYYSGRDSDLENPPMVPPPAAYIGSFADAERLNQEGLGLQTQGKFREAIEVYQRLVNGIQNALDDREPYFTDADFNSLRDMKNLLDDTCFALEQAIDYGGRDSEIGDGDSLNFPGFSNTMGDLQRQYGFLVCQVYFGFIFQGISIPLAIALLIASGQADCSSKLAVIGASLYLPFGFYFLVFAYLINKQLKALNYNPLNLQRSTMTAFPQGTFGYKVEILFPLVSFFKFIWFLFAMITMFKETDTCEGDPTGEGVYSLYVAIVVLSSLELWFIVLLCFCIPVFCCCFCILLYQIYQHYQQTKPVGMKKNALKRLESMIFREGQLDDNRDTCAICLTEFEDGEKIRVLPCSGGHAFHKDCIDKWLVTNDSCPQCREHLTDLVNTPEE